MKEKPFLFLFFYLRKQAATTSHFQPQTGMGQKEKKKNNEIGGRRLVIIFSLAGSTGKK